MLLHDQDTHNYTQRLCHIHIAFVLFQRLLLFSCLAYQRDRAVISSIATMKRIRLQVALMLPIEPGSQSSSSSLLSRREFLQPWLQVCTEEITLQDLAHEIVAKFSRIHAGRGYVGPHALESLV